MTEIKTENNEKKGRFIIYENDEFAGELTYKWEGRSTIIIEHTEVKKEFGGKGFGKKLVLKSVEYARKNDLKILSHCSYAKKILKSDDSFKDISK
jgi:predicted GNAT family acetyltransferase